MPTGEGATRWTRRGTASVIALRPLLAYARSRGVDADAILGQIGVVPSTLEDPDVRIPDADRSRAWAAVAAVTGDASLGLHVAERATIGAYDALDYSLYLSNTFGDSLDHFIRFHRVLCDAWALKREREADVVRMRCVERMPRHETEALLAVLVLRARELTGHDVVPREVRFAHPAPADTSVHAAVFRAPARFGSPVSEVAFRAADLALAVRTANPGLNRVLERYLGELLARLPSSDSYVERVRGVVARVILAGRPSLGATARKMHSSPRTLQRRLGEEGTSHLEIVDSVRRELAERLVTEGKRSITEIAFLLGFADLSGFRRVYRRWTGAAPSRQRATAAAPDARGA